MGTPHWIAQKTWDFFATYWGRWGTNGVGWDLQVDGDYNGWGGTQYNPASNRIYVSNNSIGNRMATYDVIGHEYMHGITKFTAGLVYAKEPGALNESFSDIFGTVFERYMKGFVTNWQQGEDAGVVSRDMSNPHAHNDPNYYLGTYWYNVIGCTPDPLTNDNCGVHTNSGVQNNWFYRLSNYIGIDKASLIAWHTVNLYLGPNASYADARGASAYAAWKLFGLCSNERKKTSKAWDEVGVIPDLDFFCPNDGVIFSGGRLSNSTSDELTVGPNPASQSFVVQYSDAFVEARFSITDMLGKQVLAGILGKNHSYTIDVSTLQAGTYQLTVQNAGNFTSRKVQVIR